MCRYLLALLLVNIFNRSFVCPLPTKFNGPLVSDLLTSLAKKCEDPFLSAQINDKLQNCSVQFTPFNEKQFECLIFYDINSQLCDAVSTTKLAFTANDTAKLDEPVDLNKLCSMAKHWNVTNLVEYPKYVNTVRQIFDSQVTCVKVCGVADILSQDVNVFCKYFKWGSEMLPPKVTATLNGDIYVPHPSDNIGSIVGPSNDARNLSEPSKVHDTAKAAEVKADEPAKTDEANPVVNIQEWPTNKLAPSPGIPNVSEKNPLEPNGSSSTAPQQIPADSPVNIDTSNGEVEKPYSAAEVQPSKKEDDVKLKNPLKNPSIDEKESSPVNEKSKSQNNMEPEDYQGDADLDDVKDLTLADNQGSDDGEDPMLSDPDIKQDLNLPKKPVKKIESMVSYNNGEMELFPNAMQEGFSDDDDHFFSFFLTAVVLVVLIYILYHNKNKVSKVILGLLVEGRQAGRRRASRGHAYRRLDTLEQAMGSGAAAPPSKIIY